MVTEHWKAFPLDTRYEISSLGRLRRVSTQRIRKTPVKQNGYKGVVFTYAKSKPRGWDFHFMVALTWLGPRPPGFDISHQDGNKLNNRVSNLVYESRKENMSKPFNKYYNGENKLTLQQVKTIRRDKKLSNNQWAKKLKVTRKTIWRVRTLRSWTHT
jgi:DNA-binding transcriptional regulator YiaG